MNNDNDVRTAAENNKAGAPGNVVESINEPQAPSRQSFSPPSINEPPERPEQPAKPAITSLDPSECFISDLDFTLFVNGSGFNETSVIHFAGHDEPTTVNEDGSLSTGVKPSLWSEPVTVQCSVKNDAIESDPVDFVFKAPPSQTKEHDDGHASRHGSFRRPAGRR